MKRIFSAIALTILVSVTPIFAQPNINQNFVTAITANYGTSTQNMTFSESQSGQQSRLDATDPLTNEQYSGYYYANGSVLSTLPTGQCVDQYSSSIVFTPVPAGDGVSFLAQPSQSPSCIETASSFISSTADLFSFLANAKQHVTCSYNGRSGTLWINDNAGLSLCANGNRPLYLTTLGAPQPAIEGGNEVIAGSFIAFNTFTPGEPAPANLCPPLSCASLALSSQSSNECNAILSGTITGDLTVNAGDVCILVNSDVQGQLQQSGGNLILMASTIDGNVNITGGVFSIGGSVHITGNLLISSLIDRKVTNQICAAQIDGDFNYSGNQAPINIGSSSCQNNFKQNVSIDDNASPIQIYDNIIGGTFECSKDYSIQGGGNIARHSRKLCYGL